MRMASRIRLDHTFHLGANLWPHRSQSSLLRTERMAHLLVDGVLLHFQLAGAHIREKDSS